MACFGINISTGRGYQLAVLWKREIHGSTYEVRSAGQTCRLYTDGVFHSQFNPRQPVGGSVWDLLMLPAFFYPRGAIRRVLVLGVGGGAVIRQLNHFLELEQVVGVELNPIHLQVAKRFFKVDAANVSLVEDDAVAWLKAYKGPKYDLIIDDLFAEAGGQPERAVAADKAWMSLLRRHLSASGALVMNFDGRSGLRNCAYFREPAIKRQFACAFQLTTRLYENHIGAFLRKDCMRKDLFAELATYSQLNTERKTCRLNFEVKKL